MLNTFKKYNEFLIESSNLEFVMKEIEKDHFIIRAIIGKEEVGNMSFIKSKYQSILKGTGVSVDPSYRRKGIGSGMYMYAERELGMRFVRSDDVLTPDGKALWDSKNRKFGN